MNINITYDSSVNNAPAGFKTAVAAVVAFFQNTYSDPITININIGYGEVAGHSLGGALGESSTSLGQFTYAQIRNALIADSKTSDDASAVATLPSTDPVSGTHTYWVSRAEAKALGLISGTSATLDGSVGFSSTAAFDYDDSNGVTAGQFDFFGVVAHEISEVMGRQLLVGEAIGSTQNGYEPFDLFHYSAAGTRDFVGTQPGYFSIDGGSTNLDSFNTNPNGDSGDWAASAGHDAFLAFGSSGVVNAITSADLTVLDVLGYDRGQASAPSPSSNGVAVDHDFNGDGTSDILWHDDNGSNQIWSVKTNQVIGTQFLPTTTSDWHIAGVGDFTGDGTADILWHNDNGQNLIWQIQNGHFVGGFGLPTTTSDWHVAGIADFTGDGTADIAWHDDNGQNLFWQIQGGRLVGGYNLPITASGVRLANTGDYNGDGTSDLLWQSASGNVTVNDISHNVVSATVALGQLSPDWHIV